MTPDERTAAVRAGYLAGESNSAIARRLGTSKSSVLGWAWRRRLDQANAALWSPNAPTRNSQGPKRVYVRKTMVERRATDRGTHAVVEIINALPFRDLEIALELGVSETTLTNWRRGYRSASPFNQQCVAELPGRMLRY